MALFRKTDRSNPANLPTVTALVVRADAPPQGAPRSGRWSTGSIRVLVNGRQLDAVFRFTDQHWVTRGMQIPILMVGDSFEVDWDAIGSMADRVAAREPYLADPITATTRVAEAIGVPRSEMGGTQPEQLVAAVEKAAATPAPPGMLRAVVLLVSVRGRYEELGSADESSGSDVTMHRNSEAVLSVHVPGRPPYAVFVPKFKVPRDRIVLNPGGLPALVSTVDPQRVEIQWTETPSLNDQIAARIGSSMQRAGERQAAHLETYRNLTAAAVQSPAPYPGAGQMPGGQMLRPGIPPETRAMIVANLRIALQNVTDPTRRQMMIDQYRLMGVEITAEELGF